MAAFGENERMARVLVVDDEPIVRDVVARYLKRDGHTILQASDGETARELLERERPALVVLDVMLPGLDGLALMRWIRARFDLPAILLTARGDESDRIVVRTFSITTAPKPASCTVPRVVGKRIAAAESLIKKAHCRV